MVNGSQQKAVDDIGSGQESSAIINILPEADQDCLVSAVIFIQDMGLRDPRQFRSCFDRKDVRVRHAIFSWEPLPTQGDDVLFSILEVHTDGSALLTPTWPQLPVDAGWGCLFFLQ